MKQYDARLVRTAITAIRLYFLDKCFNNSFKHFRNSLFIIVAQSSYILTFKFCLCSNFIISWTGNQRVYTSFSYQHQTELADELLYALVYFQRKYTGIYKVVLNCFSACAVDNLFPDFLPSSWILLRGLFWVSVSRFCTLPGIPQSFFKRSLSHLWNISR